jgi:hypothetical protein
LESGIEKEFFGGNEKWVQVSRFVYVPGLDILLPQNIEALGHRCAEDGTGAFALPAV